MTPQPIQTPPVVPPPVETNPKKPKKVIFVVLSIIVLVVISGLSFVFIQNYQTKGNNQTSEKDKNGDLKNVFSQSNSLLIQEDTTEGPTYSVIDLNTKQKKLLISSDFMPIKQQGPAFVLSPDYKQVGIISEAKLPKEVLQNYNGYKDRIDLNVFSLVDFSHRKLAANLIPTLDYANSIYINTGLAWSSDNRIIYLSGQSGTPELWIVNSDGSGAKQITNDSIENPYTKTDFSWSPDNKKILYRSKKIIRFPAGTTGTDTSGGLLKLYDLASGSEIIISSPTSSNSILSQLSKEYYIHANRIQWLDNNRITAVFESFSDNSKKDTQGIWIINLSTLEPQRIVAKPIDPNSETFLSPSKKYLVFTTHREGVKPREGIQNAEIVSWVANLQTKGLTELKSQVRNASWSPNSKYLCYEDSSGLWVLDIETNQKTQLYDLTNKEHTNFPSIAWLQDSSKIAYQQEATLYPGESELPKEEDEGQGLWIVDRDGKNLTRLLEEGKPIFWQ